MHSADTTILIIDDDPPHLKIYSWILQSKSYKCKSALVNSTSLELRADAAIDLVLLDYRLNICQSAGKSKWDIAACS